jgi:hypothetical protein
VLLLSGIDIRIDVVRNPFVDTLVHNTVPSCRCEEHRNSFGGVAKQLEQQKDPLLLLVLGGSGVSVRVS